MQKWEKSGRGYTPINPNNPKQKKTNFSIVIIEKRNPRFSLKSTVQLEIQLKENHFIEKKSDGLFVSVVFLLPKKSDKDSTQVINVTCFFPKNDASFCVLRKTYYH